MVSQRDVSDDVDGNWRSGECVPGRPATLGSTLPLAQIGAALGGAGHAWVYSDDAGTCLCNHLFYGLAYATSGTGIESGFVHVSDWPTTARLTSGSRVILQGVADNVEP